jgi:hypothetical protein
MNGQRAVPRQLGQAGTSHVPGHGLSNCRRADVHLKVPQDCNLCTVSLRFFSLGHLQAAVVHSHALYNRTSTSTERYTDTTREGE